MPEFSGPEALRCFRETGLDVPFIMVSGIYGEEAAVEMMKAGANDYLLKKKSFPAGAGVGTRTGSSQKSAPLEKR